MIRLFLADLGSLRASSSSFILFLHLRHPGFGTHATGEQVVSNPNGIVSHKSEGLQINQAGSVDLPLRP